MTVLVDISGCISRFQRAVRAQKILLYMNSNDDSSHIARDTWPITNHIKYIAVFYGAKLAVQLAVRLMLRLAVRCAAYSCATRLLCALQCATLAWLRTK